jgi:hypothetical protein
MEKSLFDVAGEEFSFVADSEGDKEAKFESRQYRCRHVSTRPWGGITISENNDAIFRTERATI